jgi:hypothetical protein
MGNKSHDAGKWRAAKAYLADATGFASRKRQIPTGE